MGYDHVTVGWEHFDNYVEAVRQAPLRSGIEITTENNQETDDLMSLEMKRRVDPGDCLRQAKFTNWQGEPMIVEEVILVEDQDCDGVSLVGIIVYPEGKRPPVHKTVLPPS